MPIFFDTKSFEAVSGDDEPKDVSYEISEQETGVLESHKVYLATSETQSISKAKRFGCFLFGHILAFFKQTIGSAIFLKKASTGRQVIAITVKEGSGGKETLTKIAEYNKSVISGKKYEVACKELGSDRLKLLKEAADLGHPKATFDLAMILKENGESYDAIECLEKIAVKEIPVGIEASFQLGLLYDQLGKTEDAIKHFERFRSHQTDLRTTDLKSNEKLDANLEKSKEILGKCYLKEGVRLQEGGDRYEAIRIFKKCVDLGNQDSFLHIGKCYLSLGEIKEAKAAFEKIAHQRTPAGAKAAFELGQLEFGEAKIKWLRLAYKNGNIESKSALKEALTEEGEKLSKKTFYDSRSAAAAKKQSEEYFKEAYDLGDVSAGLELGWIQYGATNFPEAIKHFEEAAYHPSSKQGEAALTLGRFYLFGMGGLKVDHEKALGYFEQANGLGLRIPEKYSDEIVEQALKFEKATPPDIAKAKRYLEKAVSYRNAKAMMHMARFHLEGLGGVTQDPNEALRLLDRAEFYGAKIPEEIAKDLYESFTEYERVYPSDLLNTRRLLDAAVKFGNPDAIKKKGICLLEGKLYPKDAMAGLALIEQANKLGKPPLFGQRRILVKCALEFEKETPPASDKAKLFLDRLVAIGMPKTYELFIDELYTKAYELAYKSPTDPAKARHLFERSASLGHADAAFELYKMYKNGLGGPADLIKAEQFEKQYVEGKLKALSDKISEIGATKVAESFHDLVVQVAVDYESEIPPASDKAKLYLDKVSVLGIANGEEIFAQTLYRHAHVMRYQSPLDLDKARHLFERSANLGFHLSAFEMYKMCKAGIGGAVDLVKAEQFEKQHIEGELKDLAETISELGLDDAQRAAGFEICLLYENEVPPATDKTKLYLDKVTSLGIPNASELLAKKLYDQAFNFRYKSPLNLDKARQLFERSALLGSKDGAFEASVMCKRGLGGPADLTKGAQFEKLYVEAQLKELSTRFSKMGTVHAIGPNIPRVEASMISGVYAPEVKAAHEKFSESLRKEGVLSATESLPYYDPTEGACAGMTTELLVDALAADPAEPRSATIRRLTQARQGRPGVTATALQSVIGGLYERPSTATHTHHFTVVPGAPLPAGTPDVLTRIRDHAAHHHHLSRAYGIHNAKLTPVTEMGIPGTKTDKECIEELMKPHHKDGLYKMIITTGSMSAKTGRNSGHAIAVLKENGKLRVCDPSYVYDLEAGTDTMNIPEAVSEYLKEAWPFPPHNNHQIAFFYVEKQAATLTP